MPAFICIEILSQLISIERKLEKNNRRAQAGYVKLPVNKRVCLSFQFRIAIACTNARLSHTVCRTDISPSVCPYAHG